MSSKRQITILVVSLLGLSTFICLLFLYLGIYRPKLSEFKILKIEENKDKLNLVYEKSNNALFYEVYALDQNNNTYFYTKSDSNIADITNLNAKLNERLTFKVVAHNRRGDTLTSSNQYIYTSTDASFKEGNYIITSNKNFGFFFEGDMIGKNYSLEILYKNKVIYETKVNSYAISLFYDRVRDYEGRLTAVLKNEKGRILSSYNFYNNPTLVSDIKINNLVNNKNYNYEDIIIETTGGDGSTKKEVNLYQEKTLIKTYQMQDNKLTIPLEEINPNTSYRIEVVAVYDNYYEIAKKDSVNINVLGSSKVMPVYLDYYEENLDSGTLISLNTHTKNADIYYTTNGGDPLKNGILYQKPLSLKEGTKLRVAAKKRGYEDSAIRSYEITYHNHDVVVYLSPSNQTYNLGAKGSGFSSERIMMNKLADVVEKDLKAAGVKVYRSDLNAPNGMMDWLAESRKYKSDLHLAIHSNGSVNHNVQGVEVFVHDEYSHGYDVASKIFENLYSIYPYQDRNTSSGIKYAEGSLGEVKPLNIKRGVLIETAFHDDMDDAKWMVANLEKIGHNIASSVLEYYQIKGVENEKYYY